MGSRRTGTSGRWRPRGAVLAVAVAAGLVASVPVAAPAVAQETISKSLHTAVAELPVAAEDRTGYDRKLFPHWVDADRDGCNTRNEVLIDEAVTAPSVGARCALSGGRWYSYYDDAYWTVPTDLDIDHMVPLAEAWDSGARAWTTPQRRGYANDRGDERALAAVTDNVNQAKGDKDPAEWLPPDTAARCRYLGEWVAVKMRWRLTADSAEKDALTTLANACPNVTITVTTAI